MSERAFTVPVDHSSIVATFSIKYLNLPGTRQVSNIHIYIKNVILSSFYIIYAHNGNLLHVVDKNQYSYNTIRIIRHGVHENRNQNKRPTNEHEIRGCRPAERVAANI